MKNILLIAILFTLALTACGAPTAPSPSVTEEPYTNPSLDAGYENGLSVRLQLTLGSLKLAETNTPISPAQAKTMLPLWQGLLNMTRTGNIAQAETDALLEQIEASFFPDQLVAIREMRLSSADLQAWSVANGVSSGSGAGAGQGMGSGGSPEARATRQAAEGVTSGSNTGNGVSTATLNALISYLQELAK